jgi:hypothetical protein
MNGTNLRDRNCLHSAIPVNYTSEFRKVFETTMYWVKLLFIFPSLSKEIQGQVSQYASPAALPTHFHLLYHLQWYFHAMLLTCTVEEMYLHTLRDYTRKLRFRCTQMSNTCSMFFYSVLVLVLHHSPRSWTNELRKQINIKSNINNNFINTYLHTHTHIFIYLYLYSSKVEKVRVLQTESVTTLLKSTTVLLKIFPLQIIESH